MMQQFLLRQFFTIFWVVMGLNMTSTHADDQYQVLSKQAESFYQKKSYALALKIYQDMAKLPNINASQQQWANFYVNDCTWRNAVSTESGDDSVIDDARNNLEELAEQIFQKTHQQGNLLWVTIQESLGDSWQQEEYQSFSEAWAYYQAALDWWGNSTDIEQAKKRFLAIFWKTADSLEADGYAGNYAQLPETYINSAIKIATTVEEKSRVNFLLAMQLQSTWDIRNHQRIQNAFAAAIAGGKNSAWYDDALYYYANWIAQRGKLNYLDDGNVQEQPDFEKAVALFQQFQKLFSKGESQYVDQVNSQLTNITTPNLNVNVSNIYLPGTTPQLLLNWRNVKQIDIKIYPIELSEDLLWTSKDEYSYEWKKRVTPKAQPVVQYVLTNDSEPYYPGQKILKLSDIAEKALTPGNYLVEVKALGEVSRDVLLITDAAVVTKSTNKQLLVLFAKSLDGAPIADAEVVAWVNTNRGNWQKYTERTNADGLANFKFATDQVQEYVVSATQESTTAFAVTSANYPRSVGNAWKVYVHTDRPTYRPGETAHFKIIAKQMDIQGAYSIPLGTQLAYRIFDAQNKLAKEGELTFNDFGSAWSDLSLTKDMSLGMFRIEFRDPGSNNGIASANLLRLEEYKLPEFKVNVVTANADSQSTAAFQLGDEVKVSINADYYFGGPVANADVEAVVYEKPYYHFWRSDLPYPWYEEERTSYVPDYGQGTEIKRVKLTTNLLGKLEFSFPTAMGSQDLEYSIVVNVIDSSRREISSAHSIKVARQPYYVQLQPKHFIYRPSDTVDFSIETMDVNDQPVSDAGKLRITKEYWEDVWLDQSGKKVTGRLLPNDPSIIPQNPIYRVEEVATADIKTDANGKANYQFIPKENGFYKLSWLSRDKHGLPIRAEVGYWVTDQATTDLGYRHGGLQIITDKVSYQPGEKAQIMLIAPSSPRYALFSVSGNELLNWQQIKMDGNVKLLSLDVTEQMTPNSFLELLSVNQHTLQQESKELIVPPEKQFLQVELATDKSLYEPRESSEVKIFTKDYRGNPISAEVSLAFVDESVYAIQGDLAQDIRQFFYGNKRTSVVQTHSTFQQKMYFSKEQERRLEKNKQDSNLRGDFDDESQLADKKFGYEDARHSSGVPAEMPVLAESAAAPVPMNGRAKDGLGKTSPAQFKEERNENDLTDSTIMVRSDFRSTAFWQPDIVTNKEGYAVVNVQLPDSLTNWKAHAKVLSTTQQVGQAETSTKTQKPLMARLQAPRFFVVGDEVVISGIINNYSVNELAVTTKLQASGVDILGYQLPGKSRVNQPSATVKVAANSEQRIDWIVAVKNPGEAKINLQALAANMNDAMEKTYPILAHGIEKRQVISGKISTENQATLALDLPARRQDSTRLTVQVTPSIAVTMLDAMPYLIDYPYGCVEQTMSRFLPTVIVADTLNDLGLKPNDVLGKVFGGIEQEHKNQTHPKGIQPLTQMQSMLDAGMARLFDMQHANGGWGWWKEGSDDLYMSAYVVWGLSLAKTTDSVNLPKQLDAALTQGQQFLQSNLVNAEKDYALQVWMLHALATSQRNAANKSLTQFEKTAFENLWQRRERLNAYGRSLLALSAHYYGFFDKAKILIENLENGVIKNEHPDQSILMTAKNGSNNLTLATAHWGNDGIYWHWSEGGVEATAFALMALVEIDPQNALVEPVMNWLTKNRRGNQWSSTKDTAVVVLALNNYLAKTKQLSKEVSYEVKVNGVSIAEKTLKATDILSAPSVFSINPEIIRDKNRIEIVKKSGEGSLYFMTNATYFSLEEPITPAGNEIFINRQYYQLVGKPTLLRGDKISHQVLNDNGKMVSGNRLQSNLLLEGKNHYEYLMIEDYKPAGVEAVELQSGQPVFAKELRESGIKKIQSGAYDSLTEADYTGRQQWVYQELRDEKVVSFIDRLPEGYWLLSYDLRAEIPGNFHALPAIGQAMYVPEIRANSAEMRLTIEDKK